jgi:hypothetical protein
LDALANTSWNARTTIQSQNTNGYRGQLRGTYLPISGGGYRANGTGYVGAIHVPDDCHTWCIAAASNTTAYNRFFDRSTNNSTGGNYNKNYGEHVRCVSEGSAY